jgi:hypothetical protein
MILYCIILYIIFYVIMLGLSLLLPLEYTKNYLQKHCVNLRCVLRLIVY